MKIIVFLLFGFFGIFCYSVGKRSAPPVAAACSLASDSHENVSSNELSSNKTEPKTTASQACAPTQKFSVDVVNMTEEQKSVAAMLASSPQKIEYSISDQVWEEQSRQIEETLLAYKEEHEDPMFFYQRLYENSGIIFEAPENDNE